MPGANGEKTQEELDALAAEKAKTDAEKAKKKTGSADGEDGDDDANDDFSDPEKAKAEIKKLRGESAKYRTKSKNLEDSVKSLNDKFSNLQKALGGEDDKVDPETKIKGLQQQNEALQMELSVNQLSIQHGIPADQHKYFKFLLAEKMNSLEEGEEMNEEHVAEIAAEVQKLAGKGQNSTGLGGGKKPTANTGKEGLTVAAFAKMSLAEKSELYTKNPSEYTRLFEEANSKKLI